MVTRLIESKLEKDDVMNAKISDHFPVVHHNTIFWNIMMKAKKNNNGFGLVEDDKQYQQRLIKTAYVIAKIVYHHPEVEIISVCEGPINPVDCKTWLDALNQFPWMKRFLHTVNKPMTEGHDNWGLIMLADRRYKVTQISCEFFDLEQARLVNRFQLWKLQNGKNHQYVGLTHLPFSQNAYVTVKNDLSLIGKSYCNLINNLMETYQDDEFTLCADFNLNPHLLSDQKARMFDQIPVDNSRLLSRELATNFVTVDGILLSTQKKRKLISCMAQVGLFKTLKLEHELTESVNRQRLGFTPEKK